MSCPRRAELSWRSNFGETDLKKIGTQNFKHMIKFYQFVVLAIQFNVSLFIWTRNQHCIYLERMNYAVLTNDSDPKITKWFQLHVTIKYLTSYNWLQPSNERSAFWDVLPKTQHFLVLIFFPINILFFRNKETDSKAWICKTIKRELINRTSCFYWEMNNWRLSLECGRKLLLLKLCVLRGKTNGCMKVFSHRQVDKKFSDIKTLVLETRLLQF